MPTFLKLTELGPPLWFIMGGVPYTMALIIGAMLLGFIGGVPLACLDVYGPAWARRLVRLYVWFFRGVPILILLFLFYYGVFGLTERFLNYDLGLSPFMAAVIVLGLTSCAYQSQIFRGAILSLPQGQFKAAQALGLSKFSAIVNIVLPQALRISIPAWSNEYSILLKDSAVAYALGVLETMARTKQIATAHSEHLLLFYIFAGLLYFILTWAGVKLLKTVEVKTKIPGLGHEPQKA